MNLDFSQQPTVSRFIADASFVRILMGPRGEGKTTGGIGALLYAAQGLSPDRLPLRVIVVRDTWTNLMRTMKDTLNDLQKQGLIIRWLEDDHEALLADGAVHLFFVGMDTVGDVSKFQGFGAAVLWIEEPAPAADLSGGVGAEVYGVGVTSLRQRDVPHFVLITMNPPDEDHWTLAIRASRALTLKRFMVPRGENQFVKDEDRARHHEALVQIGREDLADRLILGKIGSVKIGQPVTPEFDEMIHVAQRPLPIIPGRAIIRNWDFGLNPTCIWSQVVPSGRWHILGTRVGQNIGVEQLIKYEVIPFEKHYLGDPQEWDFRDIGDPAGATPEQSNSDRSAVLVLQQLLNAGFEPGPVDWPARRDSLRHVLRNGRMVQIDPDENKPLIRALRGGWHYPKNPAGTVIDTILACKRASGIHSHPGDAAGYGAAVLFPLIDRWAMPRRPQKTEVYQGEHAWMGR